MYFSTRKSVHAENTCLSNCTSVAACNPKVQLVVFSDIKQSEIFLFAMHKHCIATPCDYFTHCIEVFIYACILHVMYDTIVL